MLEIAKILISSFISLLSVIVIGKIVLETPNKIMTRNKIIIFLLICIVQAASFIYLEGTIKTLIMFLSIVVIYKYVFELSLSKSILIVFLTMVICIIPEILEILFITKVLGFSEDFCYDVFANSLLSNIIIFILTVITVFLLRKVLRKIMNIKLEDNIKITIYYILIFICISVFFYKILYNLTLNSDFIISILIILAFLLIFISLIKQTIENNKISKEYDELLKYMTTFENEIEKQRILRHEAKNEFLTIRAKICDKQENKEIVKYIDEILKEKIKVKQEEYAKFGYLPPNGIKGLCYFKVQEAEEKNVTTALNISKKIKDSTIYDLDTKQQRDFGRILGVLLDNAIEASMISEKKQMGIEAYTNSNREFKIIISNTYNNDIDKNKIGKEKFSTKGKNRGHGLLLVEHIINKNNIFELKTEIQDKIYIQKITIKKV